MSEKIGLLGWRLRPGKEGKNTPTCDDPPREPQTHNLDGLNTSPALATGELWNYKSLVK